jgi:TPR repeat protein
MNRRTILACGLSVCLAAAQAWAMTGEEADALVDAATNKGDQSALARLQQAAQSGDPAAETGMGNYAQNQSDGVQACAWYWKAARQGHPNAQNDVGNCYENGIGVAKDPAQAVWWYSQAAQQGNLPAESNLGAAYTNGDGVARDYAAAFTWLQKAAKQGFPDAENNLGNLYYNGEGVERSYEWAAYWWQKATDQGSTDAVLSLTGSDQFGPRLFLINHSNQTITGLYFCPADGTNCSAINNLLIQGDGESSDLAPGAQDWIYITMSPMNYATQQGAYYVVIETSDISKNYFHFYRNIVLNAYQRSTFTFN